MHATPVASVGRRGRSIGLAFLAFVAALGTALAGLPGTAMAARTDKRGEVTKAVLDVSALQPGKPATAAVVFDIKPGFHAQSATAKEIDNDLIPFTATPDENPALTFGSPVFPPGKLVPFTSPPQISVYEDQVVVRIPVQVKGDAPLGPTKITGKVHFQICDNATCFRDEDAKFSIDTEIVAADKAVEPANPDVFRQATRAGTAAVTSGAKVANPDAPTYSLLGGLGIAFLVGIVFNAVPCVLPVLPLKALGFYEASQHSRARSIAFGLTFSLGVVASFAVLGFFVVVLKSITWGELFSNRWFVAVLALILVVMALNMFGLFTINLPGGMYAFTPRHDTYVGNFLFGILTAALSTPCTFGLFVGVLSWAITQTATVGMLTMVAVGAGMASPYVVLSAFPGLARRFPRTGPWGEVVKQFMGFLLLGVAVFFGSRFVAKVVGGEHNVPWVIFAILAAGAIFLVARSVKFGKTWAAPAVATALGVLLVAPALYATWQLTAKPYQWTPYSAEALDRARAANKVVLIDFTAEWCLNCKTVEAFVLNTPAARRAVQDHDVQMIKADLTDRGAPGQKLLDDLNGRGIPLTVIYSPSLAEPIQLPGIYSVDDLKQALAKASQPKPAGESRTAVAQQ